MKAVTSPSLTPWSETLHAASKRLWALSFLVGMLLSRDLTAQQSGLDASALYRRASPSIALILTFDRFSQPLAQGSGFFIDDSGTIATNYHVIEGATTIQVKSLGRAAVTPILGVSATNVTEDLAVLKTGIAHTAPLPLGVVRPTIGERVFALGNPLGLEGTISEGIVSGIRQLEDGELYQITSPISPGSSGGPVLNSRGEVIGVATAALRSGQNLNFAVPSASLDRLRRHQGPTRSVAVATADKKSRRAQESTDAPHIRFVDIDLEQYGLYDQVSMYNGTQYTIKNVKVRTVCWKEGVDVPVDSDEEIYLSDRSHNGYLANPLAPGLSVVINFRCKGSTTNAEFRVLDFDIVN